jgi:DNA polymerase IV
MAVTKGLGRSCVIAASKEAKQFGVKTGSSLKEAKGLCPEIIAVPADFDLYLSATTQLKKLFEQLAPHVEIFSLDEAFMDLSDCWELYPDAPLFAQHVQAEIKNTLGNWVTCNIGISHNRLLAKLTSEVSPKGSITTVTRENKDALLARVSFGEVCGVGYRLQEKLAQLHITTPYQLNFVSDDDLVTLVGPYWAAQLRLVGQGEETHFLTHSGDVRPHMKSVGRSITGYKLCDDEETLKQTLYNLTEEVIYKVRKMGLAGRQVHISLRGGQTFGQPQRWHEYVTMTQYIRHTPEMFDILYHQLYKKWRRTFPVIKCSVGLSLLKPWAETPQVLWPEWHRKEKVAQAIDELTQRYGLFTVRPGTLAKAQLLRPEVTGFLGDKEFQLGRL